MKKNTDLLLPDTFYHVYNRGINGEDIFKSEKNYSYFLSKYALYISPIADTFAYCLLKNHFHLLIKVKSESDILSFIQSKYHNKTIESISYFISNQFSHFFNSYTQSINKDIDRTGGLFESPFRRIKVESNAYFAQLVYYIHTNPQKHGLVADYRDYKHSSYATHLSIKQTNIKRDEVISWFGSVNDFTKYHFSYSEVKDIKDLIIEL